MNTVKFNNGFDLFPSLLFNELETLPRVRDKTFLPTADVSENDEEYTIHLIAPGLKREDFNVKVDDNVLIISGERKKPEKKFNLNESVYGKFLRKFTLSNDVNVENISANYVDGILNIKIPKDTMKTRLKQIQIN